MALSGLNTQFTILGLWVLGLVVSHINESNCKLKSQNIIFNDKSAILLHPGNAEKIAIRGDGKSPDQKVIDMQLQAANLVYIFNNVVLWML